MSSLAGAKGIVYGGSYDKNVYAFKASTGAPIWKYTTGGQV
jgi:outer membrane protein assembly factor BamB